MLSFNRWGFLLLLFIAPCSFAKQRITVTSPDKKIEFFLSKDQSGLTYRVSYNGQLLVNNLTSIHDEKNNTGLP